ncbi:MAG: hypothetical protein J6X58_01945 [Bacteroidales bacterium]|nr:hypothetical protein [Bacteroidales bacterium]
MAKKEKKDQYIIAYITDFDKTETVLSYATFLAYTLQKGLIILHICDPRYSKLSTEQAEQYLKSLLPLGHKYASDVTATYAVLKGKTAEIITALPTLLGAVAIVAQVDVKAKRSNPQNRKTLLKNFSSCKTAFLVAQEPLRGDITDISMAVDFKKESKDKFIWSSYLPRFGGCRMHVLYYDYKDEFLKKKWYANMTQLHKLYTELGISFQPHIIESKSTFQDINALRFSADNDFGMMIAVTTKEKDGLEFFIGVQENRTIVNSFRIPILFLNQREDLYVLCD